MALEWLLGTALLLTIVLLVFAALRLLKLDGALPIEGGLPIVVKGALVGAVGVSGGTSAQDGEAAAACVKALDG